MDREYLLSRHHEELERAREAVTDIATHAHEALARAYKDGADRLDSLASDQESLAIRPAA